MKSSGRRVLMTLFALAGALGVVALTASAANTIVWQSAANGLPAASIVRDVAFGDVNNDGKPDFVIATTAGLSVYAGDGVGNWSSSGMTTGLPSINLFQAVALGDVNHDGKLDLVATGGSNNGVTVWLGNGLGSWTAITSGLPITGSWTSATLADVNQDGRLDVIAAGSGGVAPGIKVYLNFGSYFSETTPITTTGNYNQVASGYVNDDGYVDVAAGNNSGGVWFWRGAAGNNWMLASTGLSATTGFRGVALGDIDNDGKLDLVASRTGFSGTTGGGLFAFLWNQSTGSWSLALNQIPVMGSYDQLALYDLNNDGWLDLIAGGMPTQGTTGLYAWLGGPNGFASTASPTTTGFLNSVTVGDLDRDGLADVAAGDSNGAGVLAWRDNGVRQTLGAWTPIASPDVTSTSRAFGIGDFNRDGNLDVVMEHNIGAGLEMWRGDGGNAWTTCPLTMTPGAQSGQYNELVVGPFNRLSQEPDVIASRDDGGGIRYFDQSGTNCNYWNDIAITTTGSWRALSAGDVDHDTYYDLIAAPASMADAGLRWWADGLSGWTLQTSPAVTGTFYATALGDFNNDGKLDIAAADGGGGGVVVFEQATRSWTRDVVTTTGEYYALAVGDFNNDGLLDVAAAKNGTATEQGVYVWLNAGASGWTPWPSPDTTGQYFDLDVGDFNHDGKLDLLAAREGLGVAVWAGDGAGHWTPTNTDLPNAGDFFNARFGHIDHDGNLDILSTALNGGGLRMWTAAEAAPPTINNLQPSGWVTTTQSPNVYANAIDSGSGISVTSAQYRYSTDGGATWSGYLPASVSGASGVTTTQTMTAANVPFNQDSTAQNVIEFSLADMVGNVGKAQGVVKIDITPPTAPASLTSSSH